MPFAPQVHSLRAPANCGSGFQPAVFRKLRAGSPSHSRGVPTPVDIPAPRAGVSGMKMRFPIHFMAAVILACGLTSCQTEPEQPEPVEALSSPARALSFPKPTTKAGGGGTGKWTEIPRDGGAEYAQIIGDMEDVVTFYGFWSEVAPNIKTFE